MMGRLVVVGLVLALVLTPLAAAAQGGSPFGIGPAPEPSLVMWPWLLQYVAALFCSLLRLVRLAGHDPSLLWSLVGASFLYGAVHAAGPGHGKVVVASALVASGAQLWRSLWLSGFMALTQGFVAIFAVGVLFFFVAASAAEATRFGQVLEVASGVGLVLLGKQLLCRSLRSCAVIASSGGTSEGCAHGCAHGCSHLPPMGEASGALSLWTVFVAGLRPCSGALLLLTLAAGQKVFWVGVVSVLAMSLGTWLSVAALSLLAVWFKDKALVWVGRTPLQRAGWGLAFQVVAALLVVVFGVLLVMLSLQWLPEVRALV